jgi:hypothetical protein
MRLRQFILHHRITGKLYEIEAMNVTDAIISTARHLQTYESYLEVWCVS